MPGDPANTSPRRSVPRSARADGRPHPDRPVLPDRSADEQDIGWGDEPVQRDDDWYRRERPPHHE